MTPRVPPRRVADRQVVVEHGFATNQAFQPLPTATGVAPYRLDLETILGPDKTAAIRQAGVSWHMVGGEYVTVPRPQEPWSHGPVPVADTFTTPAA